MASYADTIVSHMFASLDPAKQMESQMLNGFVQNQKVQSAVAAAGALEGLGKVIADLPQGTDPKVSSAMQDLIDHIVKVVKS